MHEGELLFSEILNCKKVDLYLNRDMLLDKPKSTFAASVLRRRIKGEPIQYILGKTEFMGLEFKIDKNIFIPRPETEILVEAVIELVSCVMCQVSCVNILDIGTGSGCIAVSLAKFIANSRITATDISKEAIKISRQNALLNNVSINFLPSDLFDTYNLIPNTYNLIVSNPPYIATREIEQLQPELQYEPRIALDAGPDGLDFYRRLIKESPAYLKEDGFLVMEMGFKQKDAVLDIFQDSGNFQIIDLVKDYNGIDRVVVAQRKKKNG